MREAAPNQNPYEPHLRASDGRMVRKSQLKAYEQSLQRKEESREEVNHSRRDFLVGAGALGASALIGKTYIDLVTPKEASESEVVEGTEQKHVPERIVQEKKTLLTPQQQLEHFGEIRNLKDAVRAVYASHLRYLTEHPKGRKDMEMAVANLSAYNIRKLSEPFLRLGFPPNYAYMIAIQETRGRILTSHAGAKGMMGIMPEMAKAFRRKFLKEKEAPVNDPYVAASVAAQYLSEERTRFDDVNMLFHAYNGGAGLFGFTKSVPKEKRTAENFYRYMQDHMNKRYRETKEKGHYEYTIKKNDTWQKISEKCKVNLRSIYSYNRTDERTQLVPGEKVLIPFKGMPDELKAFFRKEYEVLHYAPEIRAKYDALKKSGLVSKLESELPIKTASL